MTIRLGCSFRCLAATIAAMQFSHKLTEKLIAFYLNLSLEQSSMRCRTFPKGMMKSQEGWGYRGGTPISSEN
jgi:hypothetical protein